MTAAAETDHRTPGKAKLLAFLIDNLKIAFDA
jgi:hypothetical protein